MTRPPLVPKAIVRRLPRQDDAHEFGAVPQPVTPPVVTAPKIVPRQLDPVALRLMALQLENDELRAEVEELRAG